MSIAARVALAVFALATRPAAQEAAAPPKPCDAKKVTVADWCGTCKRVLGPDDVLMNPKVCKRCDEAPGRIEYCVKAFPPYFQASCHPKKRFAKPFVCCGKLHATPVIVEDRALVRYECKYCKAAAPTRNTLEHKAECSNPFGVIRVCSKSGTPPHGGR